MTYRMVALLPMKHTSRRVGGKNYRPFGDGRLLFEHMLSTLLACKGIDKVVINTDSDTIKDLCAKSYPDVLIIDRPAHLATDEASMNDVIKHDVEHVDSQFYLQTHSTNPLLSAETVNAATQQFFDCYPAYNSLFSVSKVQSRLWDELARPVNHNANILLRTQDLPPVYEENSCVYIFEKENFLKTGNRIAQRPYLFETEFMESVDIDNEFEFNLAENIWKLRHSNR